MTRTVLALVAAGVVLGGCESTGPEARRAVGLRFQVEALSLTQGDTALLELSVYDQHGEPFAEPPAGLIVHWLTSSVTTATVAAGTVVARNGGEATITAGAAGLEPARARVTVALRVLNARLSFSYSGDRAGEYAIDEAFSVELGTASTASWAVTYYDRRFQSQDVLAVQRRADGRENVVVLWSDGAPVTAPGERTVSGGIFLIGYNPSTGGYHEAYDLEGSLQITGAEARQIAGTLSLSGLDPETGAAITIGDGSFDLPVIADTDVVGAAASLAAPELAQQVVPEGEGLVEAAHPHALVLAVRARGSRHGEDRRDAVDGDAGVAHVEPVGGARGHAGDHHRPGEVPRREALERLHHLRGEG
jgi:hypothetical protein